MDLLVFYVSPRDLGLRGLGATVGIGGFEAYIGDCRVSLKPVGFREMALGEFLEVVDKEGLEVRTAMPRRFGPLFEYHVRSRLARPSLVRFVDADPWTMPMRANDVHEALRNIAYLHGVLEVVMSIIKSLPAPAKPAWLLHHLLIKNGLNGDAYMAGKFVSRFGGGINCRLTLTAQALPNPG